MNEMFYVRCPNCDQIIEIEPSTVGPDRTDLWNVIECEDCDMVFNYDDEEVETVEGGRQ